MNTSQIIKEITLRLNRPGIDRVILFGSQESGMFTVDSDIDLLVVTDDDEIPQNFRRKMEIHHKINSYIQEFRDKTPIDLLVYTKGMYQKMLNMKSLFSEDIINNGILLYEGPYQGMD